MSAIEKISEVQTSPSSFTYEEAVVALGDVTTGQELYSVYKFEENEISGLVYAQTFHPIEQTPLRVYPMIQLEIIGDYPRISQPVTELWKSTVLPEIAEGRTTVNEMAIFLCRRDLGLGGRNILELIREQRRFRGGAELAHIVLQQEIDKNT